MDFGNLVIILIALYFIVKWAVKNGIKEAYTDIKSTVISRIFRFLIIPHHEVIGQIKVSKSPILLGF